MKTLTITAFLLGTTTALAGANHAADQPGAILSPADSTKSASFDIIAAHAHQTGRTTTFHITTSGPTGDSPTAIGQLPGAPVNAYVWPTSLDPSAIGFPAQSGILALAATSHPDFDDTPLYDENADGDLANDGALWHSHWVVLAPTPACGDGALGVVDITGDTPDVPATWPGLPILLDSPGYTPLLDGTEITITAAFANPGAIPGSNYDGVTATLMVNADATAPLLCVTEVLDVASGDLSLPGVIN